MASKQSLHFWTDRVLVDLYVERPQTGEAGNTDGNSADTYLSP